MNKLSNKQLMYKRIEKHGDNLKAIFNLNIDSVKLCKLLRRREVAGNDLATRYCNGDIDHHEYSLKSCKVLSSVKKILFPGGLGDPELNKAVFLNGDCRGYALKIEDRYVRDNGLVIERDWGGNGLIAPDLTN